MDRGGGPVGLSYLYEVSGAAAVVGGVGVGASVGRADGGCGVGWPAARAVVSQAGD